MPISRSPAACVLNVAPVEKRSMARSISGVRSAARPRRMVFGPPGFLLQPADAWFCGPHRQDGERLSVARYRPNPIGDPASRLL